MGNNQRFTRVSRRDFFKTTALAGMAVTLPLPSFAGQGSIAAIKPSPAGNKRNLLFMSNVPERHEKFISSIKSIKEYQVNVTPVKTDFKNPLDLLKPIREKNADIVVMHLSGIYMSSRKIAEEMGTLDIPVILLPVDYSLIMWETDLAASFRIKGTNALVANSEDHAIDLIKIMAAPRALEGKKALMFGRPFDSTSIPAPNLNKNYVYRQTGVSLEYRPIDELKERIKEVDDAAAKKEMERWKKGAVKIVEPPDTAILESARLSVLLRSIVDSEGLSGISIDCLSFTFGSDRSIPVPCLAITRLRDEGVAAPCETDVCMMLSCMVMQEVSRRPSFVCNVSGVDVNKSTTVLRHCVAPTKIYGPDSPGVPYILRDYHGMGGVTSEIEYPIGLDITMGGFSKDLKSFMIWPGRVQPGVYDTDTPSFKDAPPEMQKMRKFCTNRAEVKINEVNRFLQSITGIHHIMVAGSFRKEIYDAMLRMNIDVIAPPDLSVPEV
ncbi:hypothetical protein ACFL1N_07595 [Thermodesulfobacteriota bacterium]